MVRISRKLFIESFRQIQYIFDESSKMVLNVIKKFRENDLSKFVAKMMEMFVFEPHFRMAYRNFAKGIERKFGNPTLI